LAWLGLAWLGLAWLGLAWLGLAGLGLAWLGLAWLGLSWLGLAWLTFLPKKMEPIEGSDTSAYINQTPENYPERNLLYIRTLDETTRQNAGDIAELSKTLRFSIK
jgi:hypothetical protein